MNAAGLLTADQLAAACGCTTMRAANWLGPLTAAMAAFAIDTPARQAAFLAQVAHESGRLVYVRELWGPTPAQRGYEGRADLGNVRPGDGFRYRGRGLLQITGRANYAATRDGLRKTLTLVPDFEAQPEMLEAPRWAAMAAGWYWQAHGLNALADLGTPAGFERVTRRINGGTNGLADRLALWNDAKQALA